MIYNTSNTSEAEKLTKRVKESISNQKTVDYKEVRESKTLSQNAYIWLVFTFIGQEVGDDKMSMYKHFSKEFPKYQEYEAFGKIEIAQVSMSHFTKEQLSVFIDEVVTWGRQEGFDIPDPEDKKALEMYNYYKRKGLI